MGKFGSLLKEQGSFNLVMGSFGTLLKEQVFFNLVIEPIWKFAKGTGLL